MKLHKDIQGRVDIAKFLNMAPRIPVMDVVKFLDANPKLIEMLAPFTKIGYASMYRWGKNEQ